MILLRYPRMPGGSSARRLGSARRVLTHLPHASSSRISSRFGSARLSGCSLAAASLLSRRRLLALSPPPPCSLVTSCLRSRHLLRHHHPPLAPLVAILIHLAFVLLLVSSGLFWFATCRCLHACASSLSAGGGTSEEEHFHWLHETHTGLKQQWRSELGLLPRAEDAIARDVAAASMAVASADAAGASASASSSSSSRPPPSHRP